jgi:hypothetical protein
MFVPVSCTKCGKPFQVPEAALGKLAPCPWCQETVTALPVSAPLPAAQEQERAKPQAAVAVQEPLSLDDEPAPQIAQAKPAAPPEPASPQSTVAVSPKPPRKRFISIALLVILGLGLAGAVTIGTVGALRWRTGSLVRVDWRTFHAPDGSCSIDLLGTPVEDPEAPAAGGRRYVSQGWYSGTKAWIAWKDLTPQEVQLVGGDNAWQLLRPSVFEPEKERLKSAFGGYEAEGGGTKSFKPVEIEYRLQTPDGLLVERFIVKVDGPRPRAYFIGMVGKQLIPDGPELNRLFTSFRVKE